MLMIGLNFARLLLTWQAFQGDAFEQIGFPLVGFERGGLSFSQRTYCASIGANLAVGLLVSFFGAKFLRDGWIAAFRRFQNWGLGEHPE